MTHAELFKRPGEYAARFVLSLFDTTPSQMDSVMFNLLVVVLALFFWVQVVRVVMTLIRRATGFERRR